VLTLSAPGAESLWDEILPEEVRVLPDDLAALDELLADPAVLAPIARRWEREALDSGGPPASGCRNCTNLRSAGTKRRLAESDFRLRAEEKLTVGHDVVSRLAA